MEKYILSYRIEQFCIWLYDEPGKVTSNNTNEDFDTWEELKTRALELGFGVPINNPFEESL